MRYRAMWAAVVAVVAGGLMVTVTSLGLPASAQATAAPVVTTQPTSLTVTEGDSATFGAAASGTPTPTVTWEVSTDGGASFTPASGGIADTITIADTTTGQSGWEYEAVFANSAGRATSDVATLTVDPGAAPAVTTQPVSVTVAPGGTATFTAAASGDPAPSVQWQVSGNGGAAYTAIGGATSDTFSVPGVTMSESGYLLEAVFTNGIAAATSDPATLTVAAAVVTPSLHASDRTGPGRDPLTGTATPDATVTLYGETYGDRAFTEAGTATSSSSGAFRFAGSITRTTRFYVVADGRSSATETATVADRVREYLTAETGKVEARVTTSPDVRGVLVTFERVNAGGTLTVLRRATITATDGVLTETLTVAASRITIEAEVASGDGATGATSPAHAVSVRH